MLMMDKALNPSCSEASEPSNATMTDSVTRASTFPPNPPAPSAEASAVVLSERKGFRLSGAAPAFPFLVASASDVRTEIVPQVVGHLAVGGAPIERFPGDGEAHTSQVRQLAGAFPRASHHRPHRPASQHLAMLSALTP